MKKTNETGTVKIVKNGEIISSHRTYEAAEKALRKLQNWRCGVCGSKRGGWGKCSHGNEKRVCDPRYYNAKIVIEN